MKPRSILKKSALIATLFVLFTNSLSAQRQMEDLGHGLVAVAQSDGNIFLSWRLWGTESGETAFNIYRNKKLLNTEPLTKSTNFLDMNGEPGAAYTVRTLLNGSEKKPSNPATTWDQDYLSILLQTPAGYKPNDASVGDLWQRSWSRRKSENQLVQVNTYPPG